MEYECFLQPSDQAASMASLSTNHEYFLSLLQDHRRLLLKVCWVYTNTSHDRDDLLQEIVGQLWKSFSKYDRSRNFSTWMYRVALNVAIDYQRRLRRLGRMNAGLGHDAAEIPAVIDDVTKQDQLRELRDLLNQQDDADRALLLLYLEGHSLREIGEVLGISESNVSTRLYRLKQSLRLSVQKKAGE